MIGPEQVSPHVHELAKAVRGLVVALALKGEDCQIVERPRDRTVSIAERRALDGERLVVEAFGRVVLVPIRVHQSQIVDVDRPAADVFHDEEWNWR